MYKASRFPLGGVMRRFANSFRICLHAMRKILATLVLGVFAISLGSGCHSRSRGHAPIVGTWIVKAPQAPFPLHLFVFHSDGTVEQSNPDAGDPGTSDSNAMGVWVTAGAEIKGKIVEVTAERA